MITIDDSLKILAISAKGTCKKETMCTVCKYYLIPSSVQNDAGMHTCMIESRSIVL